MVRPLTPINAALPTLPMTLVQVRVPGKTSLHSAIARSMLSNCRPIPLKPTKALTFDRPIVSRLALTRLLAFVALEIYRSCPVFFSTPKPPVTVTKPNRLMVALPALASMYSPSEAFILRVSPPVTASGLAA